MVNENRIRDDVSKFKAYLWIENEAHSRVYLLSLTFQQYVHLTVYIIQYLQIVHLCSGVSGLSPQSPQSPCCDRLCSCSSDSSLAPLQSGSFLKQIIHYWHQKNWFHLASYPDWCFDSSFLLGHRDNIFPFDKTPLADPDPGPGLRRREAQMPGQRPRLAQTESLSRGPARTPEPRYPVILTVWSTLVNVTVWNFFYSIHIFFLRIFNKYHT